MTQPNPIQQENPINSENQPMQQLPLSYVMWLTMRSRFIDELCKTDTDMLNLWSQYENEQIDLLEREVQNVV